MKTSTFGCALAIVATASAASAELVDYTVNKGDTCDGIAGKLFGDPKRIDLLHQSNPQLGPLPHHLKPGQVLKVPRPGPAATVTFVRNLVEAATPAQHRAARNEPLSRGHKVSTLGDSSAEVTFFDLTRLQLGEHTLIVILGNTGGKAASLLLPQNTDLLKGTLRAHLAELSGKGPGPVISTPGATVGLGAGEAKVHVDDKSSTRLAVYKGQSSLTALGKKVNVDQGFGSKAEKGKAPTKPKPLPVAPTWSSPLPTLVLTQADEVEVAGKYTAGSGAPPSTWHVQLSNDAAFNDLVVDVNVPADVTKLEAKKLKAGNYFARVAAVDSDAFEGAYSPVASARVVRARIVMEPGKNAAVDVGTGLHCALDGGAIVAVTAPVPLSPARPHTLRCALWEGAADLAELKIDAKDSGSVVVTPKLGKVSFLGTKGSRVVSLGVVDPAGAALSVLLEGSSVAGVTVGPVVEDAPGAYHATITWASGTKPAVVNWVVNGTQTTEMALENTDAPAAPVVVKAPEPVKERNEVKEKHVELGALAVSSPTAGVLGVGLGSALELAYRTPVGPFTFAIGLRPGFEQFALAPASNVPCTSTDCAGIAYRETSLKTTLFGLSIPVSFRLGAPDSTVAPYLTVAPLAVYSHTAETTIAVRPAGSERSTLTADAFRLGAAALLGLQLRASGVSVFAEAGYRLVGGVEAGATSAVLGGPLFAAGFRQAF